MRIGTLAGLAGALVTLAAALAPSTAHADLTLGADLEYVVGTGDGLEDYTGFGLGLRLGYDLDFGLFRLAPELGGSFHGLDPSDEETVLPAGPEVDATRGFVGARIGLGGPIAPVAFAHVGYGSLEFTEGLESDDGFTLDAGVGLDFTALPALDVGVHAAWYSLDPGEGDALQWIGLGAHVQLYL